MSILNRIELINIHLFLENTTVLEWCDVSSAFAVRDKTAGMTPVTSTIQPILACRERDRYII